MDNVSTSPAFECEHCGRDDFDTKHQMWGHFAQCGEFWFDQLTWSQQLRRSPGRAIGESSPVRYLDERAELLAFGSGFTLGAAAAHDEALQREAIAAIGMAVAAALLPTLVSRAPLGPTLAPDRRKRLREHPEQFAGGAALGYVLAFAALYSEVFTP
ncbi:hypothetical protein [Halomarina oriensis]|uniref:Uncharacterized protein n=1 Tax=Halomarina oriensis TaxID=671145 RepID=A0A6B0GRY4_9EURY|nr:hypothetical protein [Halomarina oriensis]MWG34835.1 hypothetical protein [Halomarina oriensis]